MKLTEAQLRSLELVIRRGHLFTHDISQACVPTSTHGALTRMGMLAWDPVGAAWKATPEGHAAALSHDQRAALRELAHGDVVGIVPDGLDADRLLLTRRGMARMFVGEPSRWTITDLGRAVAARLVPMVRTPLSEAQLRALREIASECAYAANGWCRSRLTVAYHRTITSLVRRGVAEETKIDGEMCFKPTRAGYDALAREEGT